VRKARQQNNKSQELSDKEQYINLSKSVDSMTKLSKLSQDASVDETIM
jgi:hypothetical protein